MPKACTAGSQVARSLPCTAEAPPSPATNGGKVSMTACALSKLARALSLSLSLSRSTTTMCMPTWWCDVGVVLCCAVVGYADAVVAYGCTKAAETTTPRHRHVRWMRVSPMITRARSNNTHQQRTYRSRAGHPNYNRSAGRLSDDSFCCICKLNTAFEHKIQL